MPPKDLLPTTFLPQLPRPKNTLEPLTPPVLLAHIALLRELYIPPIHGGFQASDVGVESDDEVDRRTKVRERRFSAGLVATMDSLGLGLDIDLASSETFSGAPRIDSAIFEEDEAEDPEQGETEDETEEEEDDGPPGYLDPFEREWAEKWLNGVVRRAQGWIEEHDEPEGDDERVMRDMEAILRDTTAVLAMMAGTSAAGSLTRHLLFPIHPSLAAGLRAMQRTIPLDPSLSPTTTAFLTALSTSPTSPKSHMKAPLSPTSPKNRRRASTITRRANRAAVPILLHDAPMQDHISVGVQTWGSAILLGREMSLKPSLFGLFPGPSTPSNRGVRVLELGAGTGLLGILCRKLLDLRMTSTDITEEKYPGLIVATDFHHDVLSNLKVCVDLNFPPHMPTSIDVSQGGATVKAIDDGVRIAKLDWTTFPEYMEAKSKGERANEEENEEIGQSVDEPFDLVLASDCVYDPTHAQMLRDVAGWVLRLPDDSIEGDIGGTYHLLSPIRPTFTPELESIDRTFPTLTSYAPLAEREAAAKSEKVEDLDVKLKGEGLGIAKGLKLGVRGEGKRSVKGRKGEGRVDEVAGYWWWEVGWG